MHNMLHTDDRWAVAWCLLSLQYYPYFPYNIIYMRTTKFDNATRCIDYDTDYDYVVS